MHCRARRRGLDSEGAPEFRGPFGHRGKTKASPVTSDTASVVADLDLQPAVESQPYIAPGGVGMADSIGQGLTDDSIGRDFDRCGQLDKR